MATTIYKEITKNTMAKLILYQAKSPYAGDVTKNCALTGKEVDNNFLNLKGEDIETIYLDEESKKLTFTRFKNGLRNCNGETIDAKIEVDLTALEYVTGYKYEDGVIKILYSNGKTTEMTIEAFGMAVATDSTISGNGSKSKPLSISQAMRTGQYQPVYGVIDLTNGGALPTDAANGEGYVTKELKSDFGMFYTSDQALLVQGLLSLENSEWRVPTKKDWDTLLNYLEECDRYKNHSLRSENDIDARGMKLGYLAGFKAKSLDTPEADYWISGGTTNGDVLRIYPTGSFSALSGAYSGFGKHAQFWSLTEGDVSCRNFYSKKFIDCVGTVTQIEEMPAAKLSIRLVKNFLGDNYQQFEEIHGRVYETKLFASESEECNQVWTMVNIDISDPDRDLLPTPMPEDATTAITATDAYYINRWNGHSWDKHEMVEGDCVVIVPNGNCAEMAEYRLECGELVNRDAFWQNKIDEMQDKIDEISGSTQEIRTDIDELIDKTQELSDRLDQEILDRESGDTEIWDTMGPGFTGATITDVLAGEIEDRIAGDDALWDALNEEISARTEGDEALQEAIDAEASARTAADEILQDNIDAEASARTAADEYLQEEIDELSANTEALEEIVGTGFTDDNDEVISITDVILQDEETTAEALNDLNDRLIVVETGFTAMQEEIERINHKIGHPSDVPEHAAVEYTDADFENGNITVFGFINASNDYGYNLEDGD